MNTARRLAATLLLTCTLPAFGATYQVGPGRSYTQINQVRDLLQPGDIVEVDGNATYSGVSLTRSGTQAQPITIRGTLGGMARPVINANGAADAFRMDSSSGINHYVVEDLVISNAINRCVYLRGNNITLRRVKVHTCRDHGILGSDTLTGDLTLTEVEVTGSGNAASPSDFHHPIYIATDQGAYPGAVLRIEKSWIHDNHSGNSIKSRAKTVKVFYNWIEATNQQASALELIGPDGPSGAPVLCPVPNGSNDANLCTGEVVGNVVIARSNRAFMARFGSDGTGWSNGRYHVVNNTFIANGLFNSNSSAMIRAFGPIQSIELHNNIFWIQQGDTVGVRIVRDRDAGGTFEAQWVNGRRVTGRRNLVTGSAATYASGIPAQQIEGLTETIFTATTAPLFANLSGAVLTAGSAIDLRLVANSVARNAGHTSSTSTAGYQIPNPTNLPALHPPVMRPDPGAFTAAARPQATDTNGTGIDAASVGAFEFDSGPAFALSVAKAGAGSGTVTSNVGGINCGATCSANFGSGAGVTLAATATTGSVFTGWTGAGCSGTTTCAVTVTAATSVTATFVPAAGTPTGVANPANVAFGGQSVTIATPATPVTLTNIGPGTLNISAVTISNTGFSQANDCTAGLAQGASCVTHVTFTPVNVGSASSSLTFVTSGGSVVVPLTGVGELSLVRHFYRAILNRAPEAGGQEFWEGERSRLAAQGANVNEVWFLMANYFFNSQEYIASNKPNTQFLTDVYNTFFNRPPDQAGFDFWMSQMQAGLSREGVIFWFMFSNEFRSFTQGIFGNSAARPEVDMVMDLFRGILNRFPETAALNAYVNSLRSAQCQPQAQRAGAVYQAVNDISYFFLFGSAEYANRNRSNPQFVSDMYNAFLRRGGADSEVDFWINQLGSGAKDRNQMRADFIASSEFGARVNAVINAGCVS